MAKITLLNFTDPTTKPGGLNDTSRQVQLAKLNRKVTTEENEIVIFDAWKLVKSSGGEGGGSPIKPGFSTLEILDACKASTKILVCTHGITRDSENCYLDTGDAIQVLVDARALARFMASVLPDDDVLRQLSLIMCYGARSGETYANHEGKLTGDQLSKSFAYKFFKELRQSRNIRLTARTGKLVFDLVKECSLVESDASIMALREQPDLTKAKMQLQRKAASEAKAQGFAEEFEKEDAKYKQFLRYVKAKALSDRQPDAPVPKEVPNPFDEPCTSEAARLAREVWAAEFHLEDIRKLAGMGPAHAKYGKFVYTYDKGELTIVSKYGSETKTAMLLHQGPWL